MYMILNTNDIIIVYILSIDIYFSCRVSASPLATQALVPWSPRAWSCPAPSPLGHDGGDNGQDKTWGKITMFDGKIMGKPLK